MLVILAADGANGGFARDDAGEGDGFSVFGAEMDLWSGFMETEIS